jgi:O-antigen/teichoic acid export membrane protein
MLKARIGELARQGFLYSLVWVASSVTSLVLLPVYTRFLSTTDYGLLEVLEYLSLLVHVLVGNIVSKGLPRSYHQAGSEAERLHTLSTAILLSMVAASLALAVLVLFNGFAARTLLGGNDLASYINLAAANLFFQIVYQTCGLAYIVRKQAAFYLRLSLVKLVLNVSLNLVFVAVFDLGPRGILYGNLAASGSLAIVMVAVLLRKFGCVWKSTVVGALFKFAAPLVPGMLMATLLHNADRFILAHHRDLSDVGIYGLGYKLPFMLHALLMQSFGYVWSASTMYQIAREADGKYQVQRITTYVFCGCVAAQLLLALMAKPLVKLLTTPPFFPADVVVPLVALGLCFYALSPFLEWGPSVAGQTWRISLAYVLPISVNIAANLLFVPRYGYLAAAWVTVGSYALFAGSLYFTARTLNRVEFEFGRMLKTLVFACAVFLVVRHLQSGSLVADLLVGALGFGVFLVLVFLSGVLSAGERAALSEAVNRVKALAGFSPR